ncbi:MAG: hypothetical protein WBQ40_04850 [Candidatus Sulfotelmatobacter sp.]
MTDATMPRQDRLRRVVILCRNFAVNLAYYRVGRKTEHLHLQDYQTRGNFWRVMSGNCIDMCVLESCKLFANPKEKHHWGRSVADPEGFRVQLTNDLGIDEVAFQKQIEVMRQYRNKFLAHLDSDEVANIPALDIAKKAVWFYHSYVVLHEAQPSDLEGFRFDLDAGYAKCEREAQVIYEQNS